MTPVAACTSIMFFWVPDNVADAVSGATISGVRFCIGNDVRTARDAAAAAIALRRLCFIVYLQNDNIISESVIMLLSFLITIRPLIMCGVQMKIPYIRMLTQNHRM